MEIYYFIIFLSGFFLLLVAGEFSLRTFHLESEVTRKFLHAFSGISCSVFPFIFKDHFWILALALVFFFIFWISRKYGFLKSIHGISRKSRGSLIFPLIIYLLFLLYKFFQLPVYDYLVPLLVMSISDPMAAWGGYLGRIFSEKYHKKRILYKNSPVSKSLSGSIFFFFSATIMIFTILSCFTVYSCISILSIAVAVSFPATVVEAIAYQGWDNFFVPAVCLLLICVCP